MIFIDHSSGNEIARLTLQNLQVCDAAEIFFLLSGYSCMAAYGRKFDRGDYRGGFAAIGWRCLMIYAAQVAVLIAGKLMLTLFLHGTAATGTLDYSSLQPLANVREPHISVASSELFRVNSWSEMLGMLTLVDAPAFFDILRPYIVLFAAFPLLWFGLRRAPVLTFALSFLVWAADHGSYGLHFYDPMQDRPWAFNPFGWQFIFLCGAGARILLAERGTLPAKPILVTLSLCIVAAAFAYNLAFALGYHLPRPMLTRVNLSPIRAVNALALFYLAMSREWRPWAVLTPALEAAARLGRHSLLIFCVGALASEATDLAFVGLGQLWTVQIMTTVAGVGLLLAVSRFAEQRRGRTVALALG